MKNPFQKWILVYLVPANNNPQLVPGRSQPKENPVHFFMLVNYSGLTLVRENTPIIEVPYIVLTLPTLKGEDSCFTEHS